MPVSRFDITEFIGDAFGSPQRPSALVRLARDRGARPRLIDVLRELPDRDYHDLTDVFRALPALPEDADPWSLTAPR